MELFGANGGGYERRGGHTICLRYDTGADMCAALRRLSNTRYQSVTLKVYSFQCKQLVVSWIFMDC